MMDISALLHDMCHNQLKPVDIKAICKSRGFSNAEIKTGGQLENLFLSDLGVTKVFSQLPQAEITLLHLLKQQPEPVDVSFFQAIYAPPSKDIHAYTFTQRYRDVLKQVQQSLVRRGILIMAEPKTASGNTKMERWRFVLPGTFAQYLPSPFQDGQRFQGVGRLNDKFTRRKLTGLLKNKSQKNRLMSRYEFALDSRTLYLGDKLFKKAHLAEWQQAEWTASMLSRSQRYYAYQLETYKYALPPFEAILYALDQLEPQQWVRPQDLKPILDIFSYQHKLPDLDQACLSGWQWGRLLKHEVDHQVYYRLPEAQESAALATSPETYLKIKEDQIWEINLQTIPYQDLEDLNKMLDFQVNEARLQAKPSPIKLGRCLTSMKEHPLLLWLQTHHAPFREAVETLTGRLGKQIIHQALLVAQIKEPGLRMAIQRTIEDPTQLLLLSDEFIAFPPTQLKTIEKIVTKSGYVIKTVQAHG